MKPLAFITLVRNESFFLPKWVNYYARTDADLFVLDHESDDGSTDHLPGRVTKEVVHHPECERAAWMLGLVQDKMQQLLNEGYDRVGYAEVDEFLIPDPARWKSLKNFLTERQDPMIPAQGWNVVCRSGDSPLPGNPMLAGRGWKREPIYDMTLLASRVPRWKIGRHGMEDQPNGPDIGLRLVHFHYADPELGWRRIQDRKKGKEFAQDGCGWQNKVSTREDFDRIWGEWCRDPEPIPEFYWDIL